MDCGTKYFGVDVLTKRTDITRLDEEDEDAEKEVDKKVTKYFLECDMGKSDLNTVIAGIKEVCSEIFRDSKKSYCGEISMPST